MTAHLVKHPPEQQVAFALPMSNQCLSAPSQAPTYRRARCGPGRLLALLAMLASLRVAPGGSGPLWPSAPRVGYSFAWAMGGRRLRRGLRGSGSLFPPVSRVLRPKAERSPPVSPALHRGQTPSSQPVARPGGALPLLPLQAQPRAQGRSNRWPTNGQSQSS